jgi:xanthine dehydrogenase FAD-binding subunit
MKYYAAQSFEEASLVSARSEGITRFLAGGTDVIVQMRTGMVSPDHLIDIKHIPGVSDVIRAEDGGWRIGIAVTGAMLGAHEGLRKDWPGVVEGMCLVGSTQVQGRATITGNLCNGSPAADSVPGLVAAGATVTIVGPNGSREVAVESVPAGPGRTNLARGELISAVHLPPRAIGAADAYLRFIPRTEMDIAVVGCAVNLRLQGNRIAAARVALGAVAPTVLLVNEAAEALVGTELDDVALERLASAASAACRPISDKRGSAEFRIDVAGVLARRVALIAYDRAKGKQQ